MFDGFYVYEWLLMVLGIVLFFVLLYAFFVFLKQKKNPVTLLLFFALDIAMIAYPSVKSVEISGDKVAIDKNEQQVIEHPEDQQARKDLQKAVQKLQARPISDPATLGTLSRAQLVLGDDKAARETAARALQKDPQQPAAKEVQTKIDHLQQIDLLTAKVKSNPNDQQAKEQLSQSLKTVSQQPLASPTVLLKVANAQKALGNQAEAEKNLTVLRKINPQLLNQHP
jgi:tetratricopeptide (TPR) repeat protein